MIVILTFTDIIIVIFTNLDEETKPQTHILYLLCHWSL